MPRALPTTVALACLLAAPATWAGKAHQHGVAQLDIAYEAGRLSIGLDSPLDNLLGFERAPRTDAERKAADAAVARLKEGAALFAIDPAAQCRLAKAEVQSDALAPAGGAAKAGDGHADLDARWEFSCPGALPAWVDVGLFDAFRRFARFEVQMVGVKGQGKATLQRPAKRVMLPR